MKVLILTLTVGQGHNSTSLALAQYFGAKGIDCVVLDTYKYLNKLIGGTLDKGYSSMVKLRPELHLLMYDKAEKDSSNARQRKTYFPYTFAKTSQNKMLKYVEYVKPDVIVCSHIFSAILITQMKREGLLTNKIPIIGIVTDFTLHPFWEDMLLDYFVVANELLVYTAERKGIEKNRILPLGIPVKEAFSSDTPISEARSALQLKDKMTVLVVTSTVGFGDIPELMANLDRTPLDFQVMLICGRNKRLYKKIQKTHFNREVIPIGYVDNMELYMDAADCVITKPGGITVSETIAKRKPLIITDPVPGVENRNLCFLTNNNLAVYAGKYALIDEVLLQLFSQPEQLRQMQRAQKLYGKRHSAKNTADFILNLVEKKQKPKAAKQAPKSSAGPAKPSAKNAAR